MILYLLNVIMSKITYVYMYVYIYIYIYICNIIYERIFILELHTIEQKLFMYVYYMYKYTQIYIYIYFKKYI